MTARRVVIDTNVLISAALSPTGAPAKLLGHVLAREQLVFSLPTFAELETRLHRPKFDRYINLDLRKRLLHDLRACALWVQPQANGQTYSRDADDDVFIEAALAADANLICSGDRDLLDLMPFDGPDILNPVQALRRLQASGGPVN